MTEQAAPTTLGEFLARDYVLSMALEDGDRAVLVAACRSAGFDPAALVAQRDALAAVEARCVVARTGRQFLDDVLADSGP